jgi:hypothetical protein
MSALRARKPIRRECLRISGALLALVVGLGLAVGPVTNAAAGGATPTDTRLSSGTLNGVSCVSAKSCVAVGYRGDKTLIESWNGTAWSVVSSPDLGISSSLFGVSCPSADACMAGGVYVDASGHHALFESWNGADWSVVPGRSPGPDGITLLGLSCVSARFCVAVGGYGNSTLIESWNGSAWAVVPSPDRGTERNSLDGVSCVTARFCVAVGNDSGKTLVESWDGSAWSIVASPTPGSYGGFAAVSCSSTRSCVAVGNFSTGTGSGSSTPPGTLTESWDGSAWSVVANPNPSHAFLFGVDCVASKSCEAVGEYAGRAGVFLSMIGSWNGTAWSVVPNPGLPASYLYGVSCVATTRCEAVGEYDNSAHAGSGRVLEESWNGSAWSD